MERALTITKALADGNRVRVIMALAVHDELCVCQLTEVLGLATPTVSRHMSVLQNAHLVRSRKQGRWVYYRLSKGFPGMLLEWLKTSLGHSSRIAKDTKRLKSILSCGPDALCRTQRKRRGHGSGQTRKM